MAVHRPLTPLAGTTAVWPSAAAGTPSSALCRKLKTKLTNVGLREPVAAPPVMRRNAQKHRNLGLVPALFESCQWRCWRNDFYG